MSNARRPNYQNNHRGNARGGRNAHSRQQQQVHLPHADQNVFGPQEGGFDTSGWGNYTNYYPIPNQHYNNNNTNSAAATTTTSNQSRGTGRPRSNYQNNQPRSQTSNNTTLPCEEYLNEEQVLQDIAAKKTIRGILRINAKQYTDAFISDPEGGPDFYIDNVRDRNRALNLDEVAGEKKPKRQWKIIPEFSYLVERSIRDLRSGKTTSTTAEEPEKAEGDQVPQSSPSKRDNKRETISTLNADNINLTDDMIEKIPDEYFQRTVKVVYLFRRRHTMKAAGLLRRMPDNNPNFALFSPMDSRIPRLMIPMNSCPSDFKDRPNDYEKSLFVARIVDIPADKKFARGELLESIGDADTIEAQSKAILMENDIRDEEFTDEVIKCLPLEKDQWNIPEEEFSKRLDLRKQCIFTIDPATARDLDDALSCERLDNGQYKIGVHIADVSFFVREHTPLDTEAAQRTTSVYLVERVIPMLPRLLCDRLCSLNPDEDRLTYSVIWTMTEKGEILEEQFARSVIRSCVKLSYDHAQDIIEHADKQFQTTDFPPITNGFSVEDITRTVSQLYQISKVLRDKRAGALTLNQPKLQYKMKPDTKTPLSFSIYQQKESNRLVEEYMLLANMRVAEKLCLTERVADKAILRRHPPPNATTIQNTLKVVKSLGIDIEGKSSDEISKAIRAIENESTQKLLIHLLAKSMQLALYCCASCVPNNDYSHYALNVAYYTHFTSPIRRYPDILVHRLLGATLDYNDNLYQTPRALEQIAQLCNEKKMNAKTCSERSAELYLAVLIREYGTISDEAVIVGVKDESLDVYLFRIGVPVRAGINNLPLDHPRTSYQKLSNNQSAELTIYWKDNDPPQTVKQVLRPSDIVSVDIMSEFDVNMKKLKLTAQLRHPNAEKLTTLANLCSSSTLPEKQIIRTCIRLLHLRRQAGSQPIKHEVLNHRPHRATDIHDRDITFQSLSSTPDVTAHVLLMATGDPRQYVVPFKALPTSYIEHGNTIIRLRVQWPQQGGDDPSLVMEISEKEVLSTRIPPAQRVPGTIHHRPQQQPQEPDSLCPLFAPTHYCSHPSSISNNPSSSPLTMGRTSSEQNDVTSTTSAALFDVIQSQPHSKSPMSESTERIQLIVNDLKSNLSPTFDPQAIRHPQHSQTRSIMSSRPSNMNEFSRCMPMPSTNLAPSMSIACSTVTNAYDPQQLSPTPNSPMKTVVCHCPKPPNHHEHDCAVMRTLARPQTTISVTLDNSYHSVNNRTSVRRTPFPLQTHPNDAFSAPTVINPLQAPSSAPILGVNPIQISSSSSDITAIYSQQSTFITQTPICPTMQLSQHLTDNNYHPPAFMFPPQQQLTHQAGPPPRMIPVSSSQRVLSVTTPQHNIPVPIQNLSSNQNRTALQNRNDLQSKGQMIHRLNSSSLMQQSSPPSLTVNRPLLQQGNVLRLDAIETSAEEITQYVSPTDVTGNSEQRSPPVPPSRSMVKSPVKLDQTLFRSTSQTSIDNAEVDQTIIDVSKGQGTIVTSYISKATDSQQQRMQSSSLPHLYEPNKSARTSTSVWSVEPPQQSLAHQHVNATTPTIIRPPVFDQTETTTPAQQQPVEGRRKRGRPRLTPGSAAKRISKPTAKASRSPKAPTIISTSALSNMSTSPTNLPQSVDLITPAIASNDRENLPDGESQALDSGYVNTFLLTSRFTDSSEQIICTEATYAYDFCNEPFDPSSSIDPSSIYENFLSMDAPTSQENQVTSSVVTPPETCNTPTAHQQHHLQAVNYIDSGPVSQRAKTKK